MNSQDNNATKATSDAEDFSRYANFVDHDSVSCEDIVEGTGLVAAPGQNVSVHYRGWLVGGAVFDESYGRGEPFVFALGRHQVITGWDEGVVGMKVGGKRRLVVPPAAGYGNRPVGSIPAGSVLIFDVELLSVS